MSDKDDKIAELERDILKHFKEDKHGFASEAIYKGFAAAGFPVEKAGKMGGQILAAINERNSGRPWNDQKLLFDEFVEICTPALNGLSKEQRMQFFEGALKAQVKDEAKADYELYYGSKHYMGKGVELKIPEAERTQMRLASRGRQSSGR